MNLFRFSLVLLLFFPPLGATQAQKSSSQHTSAPKSSLVTHSSQVAPFDKLELFAFLAAGPFPPYAAEVIHERQLDFEPDDSFLRYYPFEAVRDALDLATPAKAKPMATKRAQAFAHFSGVAELIRNKQCAEAESDLQASLDLAPDSASLHYAAASCRLVSHDWPVAEKELRESLRLWPGNSDAHGLLGYVLSSEGHNTEAIAELRESLRLFPKHQGSIMLLGMTLARTGQYDDAIPVLKESSELNQKVTYVEKMLGFCYISTNQPSEALEPLTAYVQSDPGDAEAHFFLGSALKATGKNDEARAQFQEAARLDPNNPRYQSAVAH